MKKTNTFRWLVALFVVIFIVSNSAMAQIKIVGDDYSNELTGSKDLKSIFLLSHMVKIIHFQVCIALLLMNIRLI